MILTTEELASVSAVITRTWNAIGFDVEEADAFNIKHGLKNRRMKNIECIEACIDADRLTAFTWGNREKQEAQAVQQLVRKMIADAGYGPTLRYLARHINLN